MAVPAIAGSRRAFAILRLLSSRTRPSQRSGRRYAFVFVCQQGELETGALLLAASLRRSLRCEYELIAGVPEPSDVWGEPADTTLGLLDELGVRVAPITNEFGPDRPTANKIACMRVSTDADKLVFLDSDMLGLRDFEDDERFAVPFNAVPAYGESFDQWDAAYRAAGTSVPQAFQPTLMSKEVGLPYFNSGFVAVDAGVPLGDAWLECMRAVVENESVMPSRFEDQASLALAVASLGVAYACMDERFNYPQLHKKIDPGRLPYFCHYSQRALLRHEPVLESAVASLVEEWPGLLGAMDADRLWAPLARHYRGRSTRGGRGRKEPGRDLVVTGIARSGAGYLSDLLEACDNCVVAREPGGRVQAGLKAPVPWALAIFQRLERIRLVEAGRDPDDRLAEGRAFDANGGGQTSQAVGSEDFVLATMSTHRYLARLDSLWRVLPDARIVVCVRNPYDTVASWKRCTEDRPAGELLEAGLVPTPADPWLSGAQQATMILADKASAAQARALVWQHFAELILSQLDRVMLVNYDDLAREPGRVVDEVLGGLNAGAPRQPLQPADASIQGGDRSNLDDSDEQAIRAICTQAAFELGVFS